MTLSAASANDAEAFLSTFRGKIFLRLLHDDYDPSTQEPRRLHPRQFYGDLLSCLAWLRETAARLNDGTHDDLKFNVFYCVNDPTASAGANIQEAAIAYLRHLYQDCDDLEFALAEPEIAGRQAHVVIESSPGKRQRLWRTDDIEAWRHKALHDHMCARHHHDPSTKGPSRLLRLPGFRNWKYPDGPMAGIVTLRSHPPLTVDQIAAHFWPAAGQPRGVMDHIATVHTGSGDVPTGAAIYDLQREKARRGNAPSATQQAEARYRDAHRLGHNTLPTDDLLNVLALIDPASHRNDWWRVLAGLHYMAGGREWGKELAEAWSMLAPDKWSMPAFEREWAQFSSTKGHPATWLTIKAIAARLKHTPETRALRNSPAFKRFEDSHGAQLEFESFGINYPERIVTPNGDTSQFRPDPRSRENVLTLLEWTGVDLYYDMFQRSIMVADGRTITPFDQNQLMSLYSTAHTSGLRIDDHFLNKQIEAIALDNKRDPVKEWLDTLPMWDGVERLETAFIRLMGSPDTPAIREILPLIMFAIVRRTRLPGYKFDMMAIIEGNQGLGKSSFFRLLMPNHDWFGEGPTLNEESKRLLAQLDGKLVVEFAELAGNSKQNIDRIKKLITQQKDEYIANHAVQKTRNLRRCIFVGSVNDRNYLRDLTDNRRFPIIPVTKELNYAEMIAERDQLWAEAKLFEEMFDADLRLSPEAEANMREMQESRLDINTEVADFMYEIRKFDAGRIDQEMIWTRLGLPYHDRSKRFGQASYVIKELRTLMVRDGWKWQELLWVNGKPVRCIYKKSLRGTTPKLIMQDGVLIDVDRNEIEELLK